MIRASREHEEILPKFGDQTVFDELRLDPYYRATARRHPDLAAFFEHLITDCQERRFSLVHGDWSPKNFLITENDVIVIDWEVAHAGDPAFDAAFLTNHLLLKSFHLPQWHDRFAAVARFFWTTLREELPAAAASWFETAALRHVAGLLLARMDGKSPVEYITSAEDQNRVRRFARAMIADPPRDAEELFHRKAECR